MKRVRQLATCVFVVGLGWPAGACEPTTLDGVKDKAAADAATPEGRAYLQEFFTNTWRLALDAASDKCSDAQPRVGPDGEFAIGMTLGDGGHPTEVLVAPDNEAMRCIADGLKAARFIGPPHDGFAVYVLFKATEPGTARRAAR